MALHKAHILHDLTCHPIRPCILYKTTKTCMCYLWAVQTSFSFVFLLFQVNHVRKYWFWFSFKFGLWSLFMPTITRCFYTSYKPMCSLFLLQCIGRNVKIWAEYLGPKENGRCNILQEEISIWVETIKIEKFVCAYPLFSVRLDLTLSLKCIIINNPFVFPFKCIKASYNRTHDDSSTKVQKIKCAKFMLKKLGLPQFLASVQCSEVRSGFQCPWSLGSSPKRK